jgi:hypothetical protein
MKALLIESLLACLFTQSHEYGGMNEAGETGIMNITA